MNFNDKRQFLTETEQDVVRVFLFSCFTGLRYSDLKSLDAGEIFDWKIRKQMHKTGNPVYVPIPLQARLLLPENMPAGKVFHVVENSHFNRTLRRASKKLGYSSISIVNLPATPLQRLAFRLETRCLRQANCLVTGTWKRR